MQHKQIDDTVTQDANLQSFTSAAFKHIISYTINPKTHRITFSVKWRNAPAGQFAMANFDEFAVQDADEKLVLVFWQDAGGRCEATQLCLYHVFKILDERKGKYLVQWTGYSTAEATWESRIYVAYICPHGVLEWMG
ncbi:hypothetical protein ACHAP5_009772 [Fusarium lateritium]